MDAITLETVNFSGPWGFLSREVRDAIAEAPSRRAKASSGALPTRGRWETVRYRSASRLKLNSGWPPGGNSRAKLRKSSFSLTKVKNSSRFFQTFETERLCCFRRIKALVGVEPGRGCRTASGGSMSQPRAICGFWPEGS